ncbi:MAG TPA: hypothetical protein VFF06_34255 [Polyangia bacterium]|nr:hypothetical protein [Polyangia bacterium]
MDERKTPTVKLDHQTLVFDLGKNQQVMWIDGVVTLPVGSVIELTNPNVNAVVERVRLLAGIPVCVCLDVRTSRPVAPPRGRSGKPVRKATPRGKAGAGGAAG